MDDDRKAMDLVAGYLREHNVSMFVPLDVIRLLLTYYLIPNLDTNYKWIWCNVQYDGQRMNLYDVANDRQYTVNMKEHKLTDIQLNIQCLSPFAVKNMAFPRWIEEAVGDEVKVDDEEGIGDKERVGDDGLFGDIRNEQHLSILFLPQMMMILDSLSGIGHRITFKFNEGAKHRIYGFNPLSGGVLNHNVYEQRAIGEYDIGSNRMVNEYAVSTVGSGKASSCIFDGNSKLFISDSKYQCTILRLRGKGDIDRGDTVGDADDGVIAVPSMTFKRSGHTLLYHKENAQIMVGGGSSRIVETFDLNKNRWDFIQCELSERIPSLYKLYFWYDNYQPFILNVGQSFVASEYGRNLVYSEFLDLREQKRWYNNDKINRYLAQNEQSPLVMF